ncbi:unnamed protein product [Toxocara canis]|uniref:SET domain-containing protein n=1 Tax=Toxocara canis TaxID=6265 RepID=A0A183UQ55_TOXCA|nr:unnamed protein product [Toxocara canis]
MGETADVDEEEQHESAINWSSLLNMADDPEMEELMRSPLDTAIHVLTTQLWPGDTIIFLFGYYHYEAFHTREGYEKSSGDR